MRTKIWTQLRMRRRIFIYMLLPFLISSCSSDATSIPLNSGRVNVELLQQNFRNEILSQYLQVAQEELIIADPVIQTGSEVGTEPDSERLSTWRTEISKSWEQVPKDKFYIVCEILYEGIFDRNTQFGKYFSQVQDQFERDGVKIESMTNVTLVEDNRRTIQFPTNEFSSSLFVCSSKISLRLANGNIAAPQSSTLAWNYYLDGSQIKNTVTFMLSSD